MSQLEKESDTVDDLWATVRGLSGDAAIVVDADGTVVAWDAGAEAVFGYPADEVLGRSLAIISHPDRRGELLATIERAAGGETIPNHETLQLARDGHEVHVLFQLSPMLGPEGQVTTVSAVARDVTSRRRAEAALQRTAASGEGFIDLLGEHVFLKDSNLTFLFAGEAFARRLGLAPQDIVGKTDYDIFSSELADEFREADMRVFRTGEPETIREHVADGGSAIKCKVPIKDESGSVVALLGSWSWLEGRATARAQLSHYVSLVESSDDAIVGIAPDGTVLSWSRGAQRLYGHTADEMAGRSVLLLASPESKSELIAGIERAAGGASVRDHGAVHLTRNGEKVDVSVRMAPILSHDGQVTSISAIIRDVTEQRRSQRALRESEERFRLFVNAVFDGINICEFDPVTKKRRLLFCNDRFVEMSGYTREELMNADNLSDLVRVHMAEEDFQENRRRILSGQPFSGKCSWLRPDGKENVYEFSAVSLPVGDKFHLMGVDRDITEGEAAAEELRASEERFRLFVSTAFDGINVCEEDAETGQRRLIFCNDRYVEMSGYTRGELEACRDLNQLAAQCWTEEEEARQEERELMGLPFFGLGSWKRPDGSENFYEWSAIRLTVGGRSQLFGVDRDVTERRRAEEALRESEERFRLLVNTVFDGISLCEFDPKTKTKRLLFCNDRFVEMSGHSREALEACEDLNELTVRLVSDEESAGNREHIGRGLPFQGTASWHRPDGKENVHEFCAVSVPSGDKFLLMGVDRDITERARIERDLARERVLFKTLLDNVPDSIYYKDRQKRFVRVSRSKAEHLGAPMEAVIGKTDADFYAADEASRMAEDDEAIMNSGRPIIAKEERITRPGMEPRWVSATKVPWYDESGNCIGTVGISRDITELKLAQEELSRRAVELEAARRESEAANSAKSDFLANMSHEIRTPMNGILGMTELALNSTLTPEQREYLEAVQYSAQELMALLNDLLDFSKIEAGKLELDEYPFELERVLARLVEPLAVQAAEKGIEIVVDVSPDVPAFLVGDAHRLGQVVINLVGNATKFTDEGEILVRVEDIPAMTTDDEVVLHFRVTDTGIGVPRDLQEAIFETFRQGDSSTTRRHGGTGLGLSISRELVQMMGGKLRVQSPVRTRDRAVGGPGSSFHFTAHFGRAPLEAARRADLASLRGRRALIVDDNATNRRILRDSLTAWGIAPDEAGGGPEAVQMVKSARRHGHAYEILLLDYQMPGVDGFDVVEELRASGDLSGTVVMMLTSSEKQGHRERCRALGISNYVAKPVGPSSLLDSILSVLGPTRPEREGGTGKRSELPRFNACILLAEDNAINQKVAEHMLARAGCRVHTVIEGGQAVEAVRSGKFDAVLMDVQLPEMDGLEATRRIRQEEALAGAHIPIIAMTAHAMKGDREKCLDAGMDEYLPKPLEAQRLYDTLALFHAPLQEPEAQGEEPNGEGRAADRASIDVGEFIERVAGDSQLAEELLCMLRDTAPETVQEARSALADGDLERVGRLAHALKGAAANLSAKRVAGAAADLQRACLAGDAHEAAKALDILTGDVNTLVRVVDTKQWLGWVTGK